jgi:hypothetical protein
MEGESGIYFDPGGPSAPRNTAWNKLFSVAVSIYESMGGVPASSSGVFVSDSELKAKLKGCIHAKSCPSSFTREDLVCYAVRLGLISKEDSNVSAPTKNKNQPKTWKQFVDHASVNSFRPDPVSNDSSKVFATKELVSMLEDHISQGQRAPQDRSRSFFLEQAVKVGLISQSQADNPLPERISKERMNEIWNEYKDERKANKLDPVNKPSGTKKLATFLSTEGKISPVQAEAFKASRPDCALRFQDKKNTCERTRSITLTALLKGLANADNIRNAFTRLSVEASRLFYERGFFIWLHLHRLVTENSLLPKMTEKKDLVNFVRRSYTIKTQKSLLDQSNDDIKEMNKTYEKYKLFLPTIQRPDSDNLVTHAAKAYAAAMIRHFCNMDTVVGRIKRFVSARLSNRFIEINPGEEDTTDDDVLNTIRDGRKDVGSTPIYNVISALEDSSFDVGAMHPAQLAVLEEVRKSLNLPDGVQLNECWLKSNIHESIRFAFLVVCTLDQVRDEMMQMHDDMENTFSETKRPKLKCGLGRGLSFVPLNSQRRRYVTLDATDLMNILGLEKVDESLVSSIVGSLFSKNITASLSEDYTVGKRESDQKWLFTGTIDTDGISHANLHFRREKTQSEKNKTKPVKSNEKEQPFKLDSPPRVMILADPGRVNLASMTVMLDGKVVMVEKMNVKNGTVKKVPLKFVFSTKQYRTMMGVVKRETIRKGREARADSRGEKDPKYESKKFRTARSEACLKTGCVEGVLKYLQASIDFPMAADQLWKRSLGKKASWDRLRSSMMKDRAIKKWFFDVKRKVKQITGESCATVVWGCKVASTGKGNLSAPTDRIAMLARMIPDWNVVNGDEYNSSKRSFVEPHSENFAPRFVGTKINTKKRMGTNVCSQLRDGFVQSLDAKRTLYRSTRGKRTTRIGKTEYKKYDEVVKWIYEGHSNETKEVKQDKKSKRDGNKETKCTYIRGLRVFQDGNITKFVDRDVNGSVNIGIIWIGDHIKGQTRPNAFIRVQLTPRSKQRVRAEKGHTPGREGTTIMNTGG